MGKLGDYEDVCSALSDKKAQDIVVLDLGDAGTLADVFVLATGNSEVHMRTLTDAAEEALKRQDVREFADAKAGHMIQIKTLDLGSMHNSAEATTDRKSVV